jgi:hypothetical protein
MAIKSFDPAQVSIIFAGIPIEGFADGTFITAARDNPSFTKVVGSDGEGARSKSNDTGGSVTVTLMQTSLSNDALSAIMALDEATGDGVGPLLIKDGLGRTLISAESAWLEKPADAEFAREISNREWVIQTDNLQIFDGGN